MSDERLTFTDAEMKEIDENLSCPVKNNPEDAYDLVTRFCDMVCDEFQHDCPFQKMAQKLKFYEDAEEKGLLLRLPVAIGSDVYFIPTKANYGLNVLHHHEEFNRVYHQKIARIHFTENGWYAEGNLNLEYGVVDKIFVDKLYEETWFLDKEEAERKLAEMKGGGVDE